MPVTPLGNLNFINQNVALPSTQASNELAKEGFASLTNMSEFQSKEKTAEKLEKVNATDEVQDEIKEKAEEEKKKRHRKDEDENNEEENDEQEELALSQEDEEMQDEDEGLYKKSHKFKKLDISI
ncbi:hypothetical protein DMB92_02925 [Campylobacter sp. MIT 99-7217]|uniref:hypothetical protein n=1 Tax=Campylobacter sp. MIT 99-7217 TaxID=535091 RepID=UPI00115A5CF8|nr:hypothetical protein [Campylobacter sp. MIT 99-7217]TQR33851.1 hypothetical protein DMB92_02925 [Campylobacter sp. MIT 99-7217]